MLILASASPRRRELLAYITDQFEIVTAPTDETVEAGTPPDRMVEELALRKAAAVAESHPKDTVVGADTVVALEAANGWEILGKPADEAHAAEMLRKLSGRRHIVYTGVAVLRGGKRAVFSEHANVEFAPMTDAQIAAYVATGEPMDKAGAYGIQGKGALHIRGIEGDFYTVMGLPVCRLNEILGSFPI
jgi:septum formation protein